MLVIPSRRQVHGSTYDTTLPPSELVNALYTHSSPTTDYTMVGSASTDYAAGTKDGEKQLEDEKHSDVEMQADDETIYKTMDAGDDAMEQKRAVAEEPADLEGSPPGSKEGSASPTTTTTPAYPVISTARAIILTILVMLASVLQVASGIGSSITIAEISRDLDIPTGDMQWISSAGSLATAASLLISGRCADILGHKAFLVLGSTVGAGMFLGMGLAQSKYELFVFRALAGVAFAGVTSSGIGILGRTFPPGPAKSKAFAMLSAGAPVGTAVGLVIAGVTTQYAATGWRTFYYISAALSAVVASGCFFVAPGPIRPDRGQWRLVKELDWIGAALSVVFMVGIMFPLASGENATRGWATPYIPTILAIGLVALALFVAWEYRLEKITKTTLANTPLPSTPTIPLFRLSMFGDPRFAFLMLSDLFLSGGFSTLIFWMTLYWQDYLELSVIDAALRFLPLTIVGILANVLGAYCVAYIPGQYLLSAGGLATALAALLFAIAPPSVTYWAYQMPACCVLVFGADAMFLVSILFIGNITAQGEQATAGSVFVAVTQIGATLVLCISTISSNKVATRESKALGVILDASKVQTSLIPKPALLQGYRAAFWTCFGFCIASAIITALALCRIGKVGRKKE